MKTAPTDLIADHLYQVNLVLWMLQPSTGVPVNSLLYKAGYRLRDLEPVLPLPLELSNKLKDDGIAASDPVSPDVLAASAAKEFLLIECKRSMFGSQPQEGKGDSQIRQARSLLLQTPSVLADSIGLQHSDVRRSHLLYVSRDDPSAEQTLGLRELSDDLAAAGYRTCPFGMLGLRVAENTIVAFGAYSPGELPEAIPRLTSPGAARIHKLGDAKQTLDPCTSSPGCRVVMTAQTPIASRRSATAYC